MFVDSYNVLLVYSLLFVDLLINITDNLLPKPSYVSINNQTSQLEFVVSSWAFTVFIIQIVSIVCVISSLFLHLFNVSDQVKQVAQLKSAQAVEVDSWQPEYGAPSGIRLIPITQRLALKLVLDKYWWSLLVGLSYLVLSAILQIIRLDPSWHNDIRQLFEQASVQKNINLNERLPTSRRESWTDTKNLAVLVADPEVSRHETQISRDGLNITTDDGFNLSTTWNVSDSVTLNMNLIPVLIILVHKLMSTCYYVSFVVVYRASTNQMVNRILFPVNGIGSGGNGKRQKSSSASLTLSSAAIVNKAQLSVSDKIIK